MQIDNLANQRFFRRRAFGCFRRRCCSFGGGFRLGFDCRGSFFQPVRFDILD